MRHVYAVQEFDVYPTINSRKCNGCGNCVEICPGEVFALNGDEPIPSRPEDCIECLACVNQCPAEALQLQED